MLSDVVVVKIGSAVLAPGGVMDVSRLECLADQIAAVRSEGYQVVVVSSGAVAAGLADLGLDRMPDSIVKKQAAAAGQTRLMTAWATAMDARGMHPAQVLLTADDLDHRDRFLSARHTLTALLEAGLVPVVNENDSISHDDIRFGDNDRLSALVASLLDAERLFLLTVVEGLLGTEGELVEEVKDLDHGLGLVRTDRSSTGVGGMASKLEAADIAARAGVDVHIASGLRPGVLQDVLAGKRVGTCFRSREASGARKRWIGHARPARGLIVVDAGAHRAIVEQGASLLPAGVVRIEGEFSAGAAVDVQVEGGGTFARGLASYSSDDAGKIIGLRSDQIQDRFGEVDAEVLVHRDDLHLH